MKYTWYHRYREINQITWGPPLQLHWKPDSKARRRKLKCCDITWALSRLWLCSIFSITTEIYFISINYYKCIGSCRFQSWLFLCINKLLRQTEQKLRIFTSFIIETPKTCQPCFVRYMWKLICFIRCIINICTFSVNKIKLLNNIKLLEY